MSAPDENFTSITTQLSPGPIADDHVLRTDESQESERVVSKAIENPSPPNLPAGHRIPTLHESRHSRLYALIVGIDDYVSLPKLSGAVNDAEAMVEFLKSHMNVPPDRIRLLLNHEASREEIVNAFKQLSQEEKIETDDPILIYYAGHGTQLTVPLGWEAGGPGRKIQGICPCDYKREEVYAIPDRSIGGLLDSVGNTKGNNITVVFDCCYSASGTRMDAPCTDVRGVVLDDKLPLDLDRSLLALRLDHGSRNMTRFGVRGLGSHVLVAACKETEEARENEGRGRFTAALLELFKQEGRMETLTYTDILKYLKPIQNQNPQVEGIHRERIIFDAKAARHRPFYSVRFNAIEGTFTLNAGSVHGVAVGTKFTIYEDHDLYLKSSPWGILLVSTVMSSTSLLDHYERTTGTDLVKPGIAIACSGGTNQALAIKAPSPSTQLPTAFQTAFKELENTGVISLVEENATLQMRFEDGHLVFDILDPTVTACGMDRVYYSVKLTDTALLDVSRILSAGSHFFWHLNRGHDHPNDDPLKVEFLELEIDKDEFNSNIVSPKGENLLRDGTIDLYIEPVPKPYGIKLTNNSDWDLFPAAFYFDHSDWSIDEYYHPGTAGQFEAEPPLRKQGGTLTIGYGFGGHNPISFRLNRKNQDLDVGHLKIIFATKSVDLRHIRQESPFTGGRSPIPFQQGAGIDTWVALKYPIIQRRAGVD